MLAHLQRSYISRNRPAVAHGNLPRVRRHGTVSLADDGKDATYRRRSQSWNVIRRRLRIAALDNLAVPCAQLVVTNDAIDRVAIPAVTNELLIHSDRKVLDIISVFI